VRSDRARGRSHLGCGCARAFVVGSDQVEAGIVKPNRLELARTVGYELKDDAMVMRAMQDLCARGAQRVVVTAGKDATLAFRRQHFSRIVPPPIVAVKPDWQRRCVHSRSSMAI